jgi:hypothetical protein
MTMRDAKIDRYIRQFMPRYRCLIDRYDDDELAMNAPNVGFGQGGVQNVFAGTGAGGITIASSGAAMFMMGPGIFFNPFMVVPSQQPILPNVNRVIVTKFIMPFTMTFSRVVTRCAASAIAGTCAFGIYSLDGNTLVLDTGGFSKPADNITKLLTKSFGPTTVPAGVYWFAWTATGTVQVPGWLFTTASTEFATDSQNAYLETPTGVFGTITNMVSTVADVTFTLSVNPVTLGFAVNDSVFTGPLSNAAFAAYQNHNFIISAFPGKFCQDVSLLVVQLLPLPVTVRCSKTLYG